MRRLCWLLTDREGRSRRWQGGGVSWFRNEAFADSIFTHQTEVFPVSTRPNSGSHHLALFARLVFFFHPLPAPLPVWQLPKPPLTLFSSSAVYSAQLLSQATSFLGLPLFFFFRASLHLVRDAPAVFPTGGGVLYLKHIRQ